MKFVKKVSNKESFRAILIFGTIVYFELLKPNLRFVKKKWPAEIGTFFTITPKHIFYVEINSTKSKSQLNFLHFVFHTFFLQKTLKCIFFFFLQTLNLRTAA